MNEGERQKHEEGTNLFNFQVASADGADNSETHLKRELARILEDKLAMAISNTAGYGLDDVGALDERAPPTPRRPPSAYRQRSISLVQDRGARHTETTKDSKGEEVPFCICFVAFL